MAESSMSKICKRQNSLGVIDDYTLELSEAVQGADCVVIATPVASIESIFAQLKPLWSDDAIYTDVGSTKGSVIAAAERVFGAVPDNLVPAHPIAGAENSGVTASVDDLFLNKRLIITPVGNTQSRSGAKNSRFLGTAGIVGVGHGCAAS